MDKKELKEKIEKLQNDFDELDKKLKETKELLANYEEKPQEYKRWRAEKYDTYQFLDQDGFVGNAKDDFKATDNFKYNSGNYFALIGAVIEYRDNLITKQKLKDLALRLNKGVEIDWEDDRQNKYCIYYDYGEKMCFLNWQQISRSQGTVYCLDENFLKIAIKEIGEEKLIELIKSGV